MKLIFALICALSPLSGKVLASLPTDTIRPPEELREKEPTPTITDQERIFPYRVFEEHGKYGCMDFQNRKVIPALYDEVKPDLASDGFIWVRIGSQWGLLDAQNRPVLPLNYAKISLASDEISWQCFTLTDPAGRQGAASLKGAILLPCAYDQVEWNTRLSALKVTNGGKISLYDPDGVLQWHSDFRELRVDKYRRDIIAARLDSLWGLVERSTGKVLTPFSYQDMLFQDTWVETDDGKRVPVILAKRDGAWGILDFDNHVLLPFEYQQVSVDEDHRHFRVQQNGLWGLLRLDRIVVIPVQYKSLIKTDYGVYVVVNQQDLAGARTLEKELVPEIFPRNQFDWTGKVIRAENDQGKWLYSQKGEFTPIQFTRREKLSNEVWIYHLTDGRRCKVSNLAEEPAIEFLNK